MSSVTPFERRDGRNLLVVVGLVVLITAAFVEGPIVVRLAVGTVTGVVSGAVFVLTTLLINRFKPDHW